MRRLLVVLLVLSTALFAAGVIAERSSADEHAGTPAGEEVDAHTAEEGATHSEESDEENESVLAIDLESTPLVVLAVVVGLAAAALATTRYGTLPGFLGTVAVVALAWGVLDVREFFHQLDESQTGIAVVAALVAALHLAVAAVSGRLAQRTGTT